MSFYFSNKRPTGARGTLNVRGSSNIAPHSANPVTAQNKALLRRLGCAGCPLDKVDVHSPRMPPTLSKGAAVYILGESPGVSEDKKTGRPFTGPSGKLIRECIPGSETCSFDNIINCRPPQNRNPTQQETQCCYPRRVKFIEEAKPRLILGLGAVPLQAIMGTSDMAGMRGRVFAVKFGSHACWYLPTYHPSFILRLARDQQKPLNSMFGNCFKKDVKKAFELAYSLEQPIIDTETDVRANIQCFDGTKDDDFERLMKLLRKAIKAPLKAIDLETKGLHPWATDGVIMTAAISFEGTNFAFALHHPKAGWTKPTLKPILELFKELIKDDTIKVAHNAPYEIRWFIKEFGPESINHAAWQCSQMQAHFLDERKGQRNSDDNHASRYQALDFLIKQYFGISYKSLFKLNKKDMSQSDLGETLIYNGADTKYGLRLFLLQDRLLEERGLLDAYLDSAPRQPTVALMQHLGVPVDQVACKKAQNKLKGEIEVLHAQIGSMGVVKKFIVDRKEFNPFSQPDVLTLFKDYLKRPEVKVLDKSGKNRLSVDKNILDKIDHPLAALIVKIRNRNKMKSTYVDELELGKGSLIFPDGKLHPSFNTSFAETGRLSCSEPNAQNWPKREDAWLRAQVEAPPGHLFVAIDYGQLEACTGAMCSHDSYLVKALWEDYDIHAEWSKRTALKCPELIGGKANLEDKGVMKKFRSLIKNKLVFPAFFGATSSSVKEYLRNATGHDIDQSIVDDLMDEFWNCFSGMAAWQKRTMKQYYNVGYVESLCGRRHHYPLTKNQAINMPIQSSAAELVCDAMNRLSELALRTGRWYLHPHLNIHDDLSLFIPNDDKIFNEAIEIIAREMLVFDYPWVNVPLAIEISVGSNWANVQPLMKLWSHKEFGFPKK